MDSKIHLKRRSDVKRITKEALVLKYMRESRKLSMRKAAVKLKISEPQINHAENGRKDLNPEFIMQMCTGYGYSYKDFLDFVSNKKEAPEALLSECIATLKRLKFEKLKTVKTILDSL